MHHNTTQINWLFHSESSALEVHLVWGCFMHFACHARRSDCLLTETPGAPPLSPCVGKGESAAVECVGEKQYIRLDFYSPLFKVVDFVLLARALTWVQPSASRSRPVHATVRFHGRPPDWWRETRTLKWSAAKVVSRVLDATRTFECAQACKYQIKLASRALFMHKPFASGRGEAFFNTNCTRGRVNVAWSADLEAETACAKIQNKVFSFVLPLLLAW